jgi:hypothetical protein
VAKRFVFNEDMLRSAFVLLCPARKARSLAKRWMDEVPVDDRARTQRAYYSDPSPWRQSAQNTIAVETRGATGTSAEYSRRFREWATEERDEYLLRESDFILNLVASISLESFEAVRRLRGDTSAAAHRRLSWMHLWLADYSDHKT